MTIKVGDRLPAVTLLQRRDGKVAQIALADVLADRKVVIFGLSGAYTGTCSTLHVPSFMRTAAAFRAKGVDQIICIAVDTPHVMRAWGESTGGTAAGISFMADTSCAFTLATGMEFSVPEIGFFNRTRRFSALVEDGVVTRFNPEPPDGGCDISAGETLLAQL